MTEAELKLTLLLYNMLSKERADVAYMWRYAGESVCDEARWSKWSKCVDEMSKIKADLRERGYEFASIGYKVVGKVQHEEYKIVPISNC